MFLTLEDLIPNALIELIESGIGRTISYQTILEYGYVVIEELKKKNIEATLFIYRDKTLQFEEDYKEIFDFFVVDNIDYIVLKENIDINYLRKRFRTRLSLDKLIAMTSDNSKQVLGINIERQKYVRKL